MALVCVCLFMACGEAAEVAPVSSDTQVEETCEAIADAMVADIQHFLDQLGDRARSEALFVAPLDRWLQAYVDHHRGISRFAVSMAVDADPAAVGELMESLERSEGVHSAVVLSGSELEEASSGFGGDPAAPLPSVDLASLPDLIVVEVPTDSLTRVIDTAEQAKDVDRVVVDQATVEALDRGVAASLLPDAPPLEAGTRDAVESDCDDRLVELLRERRDLLVPGGEAGEHFIAVLDVTER